jgi:hypothetical protein
MNIRLRGTEADSRPATGRTGGRRRSRPGPGHQNRPGFCGRDVGWYPATAADPAAGSCAGPAAESIHRRPHESDGAPLPDRKAKP